MTADMPLPPKLEPCRWPECREFADIRMKSVGAGYFHAVCMGCGSTGPMAEYPEEAARLWNTRPAPTAGGEMREVHDYEKMADAVVLQLIDPDHDGLEQPQNRRIIADALRHVAALEREACARLADDAGRPIAAGRIRARAALGDSHE